MPRGDSTCHPASRFGGLTHVINAASLASATKSRTYGRLYVYDTRLERLPPPRQPIACALGPLVQEQHAVMRPRPLVGHGHLPAADPADIGDGVVRRATGSGGDHGRARAGEAGDAGEARGREGLGQDQRRYDSLEPEGGTVGTKGSREERLTCLGLWWMLGAEAAVDVI
jgi:hypothetical protein